MKNLKLASLVKVISCTALLSLAVGCASTNERVDICPEPQSQSPDYVIGAGDQLQIFGDGNSVFEMAEILNTIPYEIISGISTRVHRVYLG